MGKSVFVMDTPATCGHCNFSWISNGKWICVACLGKQIGNDIKPDWCPLTELPEKKLLHTQHMDYVEGFNDCLDTILSGGTENAGND